MGKRNSKKIRKIKKNRSWISIVILVLLHAIIGVIIYAFSCGMLSFFVQNKAFGEYDSVKYMASLYDRSVKEGKQEEIYSLLNEGGREYLIRDKEGNTIYSQGDITFAGKRQKISTDYSIHGDVYSINVVTDGAKPDQNKAKGVQKGKDFQISKDVQKSTDIQESSDLSEKMYLYEDSTSDYINIEGGDIEPDYKAFYKLLYMTPADDYEINADMSDKEIEKAVKENISNADKSAKGIIGDNFKSTVHLPFWVSVDVADGNEEFIAKSYINFAMQDLWFFLAFLAFLGILAFIVFVILLVNIISNIVNQRKVIKLLFTDMVTNGHNMTWFLYKGEQFLRKRKTAKYNYAVINLVFLKYRNFCTCHSVEQGQVLLKKVYSTLGKKLEKKEMLAHVSDSDYALLLKYDDIDRLKMRVQSIILELEKIDAEHVFSFQAGVAPIEVLKNENGKILRRKYVDLEAIYNNACTARGTLEASDESLVAFFDEKLIEDQRWMDKVTERQRYALEHEEFVVYYQPKYDPGTDKLRGAEALIRWQNDDMGFVPPGRFIPIFEKNGFITEIDHYMLENVAKDQKAWLDKGYKCVPVSVNISRAHFIESDLAEQIRDIVDGVGTPHEYIELELTESAFFDDKKAIINTIKKLKEYGFAVSMDDFGSGYSSLNSLKDMPLDVLKLDAEFFRGEAEGDRGEIVISEAIKLAKSLNMRTVAEGVEVKEQVEFLAKQGCDMIQGYYYAKPMPKEDYVQRMMEE